MRFILRAKEPGFTLAETRHLLELRVTDAANCDNVAHRARSKIDDVEVRIRELIHIKDALGELLQACAAHETGDCPILGALDDRDPPSNKEMQT